EFGLPFSQQRADRFRVVDVDFFLQAKPGQGAVHRAGIHIDVIERPGDHSGIGAFAAGARAVDGNDDGPRHAYYPDSRIEHGSAAGTVAQICNLLYRRFATCWPLPIRLGLEASAALTITNRRYSRLQICATPKMSSKARITV